MRTDPGHEHEQGRKEKTAWEIPRQRSTLRLQLTLTFILVLVAAITVCILLNVYFLESYYTHTKTRNIREQVDKINAVMAEYDIDSSTTSDKIDSELSDQVGEILDKAFSKYNLSAIILNSDNKVVFNTGGGGMDMPMRLLEFFLFGDDDNDNLKAIYQEDNYKIFVMDERHNSRFMEAFGFLDCGLTFMINTPLESIKDSADISNRLLVVIGIIVAMLGGLYIFFTTRHMTRPIQELTDIASRMADQEFDVRYEGSETNEIGVLGETMNHLAGELEKSISDLRDANEQLQIDIEEKIKIDEMRKEFLSNVSHELKTPIAIIQGYAEGLLDNVNEDEESRQFYCEVIMDEAGKMNQMVQKLLNLEHMEFGDDSMEIIDFDMDEMIRNMMDSTRILLDQKGGTITYDRKTEDMMVSGDSFMMEEVLKNYISNACNHLAGDMRVRILAEDSPVRTPGSDYGAGSGSGAGFGSGNTAGTGSGTGNTAGTGSGTGNTAGTGSGAGTTAGTGTGTGGGAGAGSGGRLRISVFNTGQPIPPDDLEKVWVKFYKVDKARTREYGGSGIGLSIVKAIMDRHHCPYGVYNTKEGVCFWFECNRSRSM